MCMCVSMVSTTKAALQEQQTYPTLLGCSSQPRFQTLLTNISDYFGIFCILIGPIAYAALDGWHCHKVGRTVSLSCTLHNPFLANCQCQ